jgi:hypothetical protein
MRKISLAILMATFVAGALVPVVSTGALATECGCTYTKVKKPNAGVGNGHERRGINETNDADPGNSGAHNKAGDQYAKPQSQAAD